ncbi:MAG: hypothetical protein A2X37_07635 [Elusimicrobia bacterium GWA2_66_18]|nr:MAG: hypothetical protein A2X37_07635 [Elusimicrobia bacterium GWA2_66_18]
MRSLFLAVCLFSAAPARTQATAADWRRSKLPDAAKDALTDSGYRFQDDGRVLDPETKSALTCEQLSQAVSRLNIATQQLALERLRLLLVKDTLTDADRAMIQSLKGNFPEVVAKAVEASAGAADLRKLADRDLTRLAAYFDASRTLDERRDAAQPVREGEPGRRVNLLYFDESERRAGDALRAATAGELSKDSFGRMVIARLNGKDGKPDIPPIFVQDLNGAVASYDYRRRALVVDGALLLMSVTEDAAPRDRTALRKTLSSRQALVDYLARHPEAAASFAAKNDALLAHELTHAWQDRREPIMREMALGNLPQAILIEYEVEAWITKNLYIHSRLQHDPRARIDPFELADYGKMTAGYAGWTDAIGKRYGAAISNAMDIETIAAIQRRRVETARRRPATAKNDRTAKSLDLAALTRADRALQDAAGRLRARLERLKHDLAVRIQPRQGRNR